MADRKPRILWANPYCLLDLSSGASMAVRQQLLELHKRGYEIAVLGATIFDSPTGITRLKKHWEKIQKSRQTSVMINDGPLKHRLVKTKSTTRAQMTAEEEARWYQLYTKLLDQFKPDLVYYYGGRTLDLLIGDEAHARGIPVAAYLANGNYRGTRWCRDVDLILTDSHATAKMYKEQDGIDVTPIGPFIDPTYVVAEERDPQNVLLVNPSLAKGAAIVIRLAMMLEEERPDITFEVVQSRGNWEALLRQVTKQFGEERSKLRNVIVTPNTSDMRPIYGRAKLLLALSLWWESFGRVATEAQANAIPVMATNRGGLPEAIQHNGILIDLDADLHKPPYNKVPNESTMQKLKKHLLHILDDDPYYKKLLERDVGEDNPNAITISTSRLDAALRQALEP
ncbi:glycosyltransferase [Spiribacter onubensis]|uniref:Glycosyltransferase n=1 Tax=Spiribacter onubensis TaxID=3122420 RepID=A0ABV3SAG1_9GAMM